MAMVDGHGSPYRHCHRPLPSTFSLQPIDTAALRLWRRAAFIAVELLDDLRREVEAGRRPRDAGLSRVEHEVQAFFRGGLVEDGRHLLHEVVLHFLLQLVDLGLRILLEALGFLRLPLDFLLELAARRLVHHAAAGLQLLLVRLELLGLVGVLGLLLLDERLHAGERGLAFRRILEYDFRLEERDLGPRRERRGRLRRRRGSGRCRRRRRRGLRRFRLGGCRLLRRLRLLGGRLGEHGGGAQRTGERRGNGVTFHPSLVLSSVLEVLDSTPLEGRSDREAELERLLRLQHVVEHAGPLRVVGEDEPEWHVQHRHEEAELETGRGLPVLHVEALTRLHHHGGRSACRHKRRRSDERRPTLHLAGVVERDQANRAGNRDLLFDVEQQALVAAEHEAVHWILRPDRPDVEAAHAVLATEEQLFKDRQCLRAAERVDVLRLPAHAEREARSVMLVPDALDERLVEIGIAAKPREIDRRGESPAVGREDRLVDRVVDVRRDHLADDPLARLADEERVAQERVAREHHGVLVDIGDLGDTHALVAVVGEQPREAAERHAEGDHGAGRTLRELADVADVLAEDVEAAGDVAIEEERLLERKRVVLRARAGRHRQREALAAAEEVRRLEGQLTEEALEFGDAGAKRQLIAVLLFELQLDVDLVRRVGRLLDVDVLAAFERLEVAELIEPLDAVLQRLGVEDAVLDQPSRQQLPPDHVVARRRVADEGDAVDVELLAFLHPHRDVDERRLAFLALAVGLRRRLQRFGRVGHDRVRIVVELVIGEAGEVHVAERAVNFARFLEPFADPLLAVELAGTHLEQRLQVVAFDDGVAGDVERAHLVTRSFADRNLQLDPARFLVRLVVDDLQLGDADVGAQIAVVAVEGDHLLGVLVELLLLVGAVIADHRHEPRRKVDEVGERAALGVVLQLLLQRAVADCLVADEVDLADLHLRTFVHVEGDVHQLRTAGNFLDLGRDRGELEALFAQHVADDPRHLANETRVDERVEADLRVRVLQLLVDLRDFDFLRADVVDDLDALPLLHVVGDDLPDGAVRERVVIRLEEEVVEEVGVPQPMEVFLDGLLAAVVVRNPDAFGRAALFQLDVIEIRLRLDHRRAALPFEARAEGEDDRRRAGGRLRARRGSLLSAERDRRQGFCRRRLRRQRRGGEEQRGHGGRADTLGHSGYFRLARRPAGRTNQASLRPASSSPAGR